MNNYDEVRELAGVAADSIGTASKRMETYTESVEAKTNQLKATWEEFVMSLNQSESYKNLLQFLIDVLNNMPIFIGYLTSILTLIIAFKSQKIISSIVGLGASIKELITGTGGLITNITTLSGLFTGHTAIVKKDTLATIENIAADEQMDIIQKKHLIAKELINAGWTAETANMKVNAMEKKGQIVVTKGLTTASSALAAAIGTVTLALSAGIAVFTIASQIYNKHQQDIKDTMNSTSEAAQREADEYNQLSSNVDNLIDRYTEITSSVGTLADKKENLKKVQKELNDLFGEEADKIDLVNGKYEEQIEKIKKMQADELETGIKNELYELQKGDHDRDEFLNKERGVKINSENIYFSMRELEKKLGTDTDFFQKYSNAKTNEEKDNLLKDYGVEKYKSFFEEFASNEKDLQDFGTSLQNVSDLMDKYGISFATNRASEMGITKDVGLWGKNSDIGKFVREINELGKNADSDIERKVYSGFTSGKEDWLGHQFQQKGIEEDISQIEQGLKARESEEVLGVFGNDSAAMNELKNFFGLLYDAQVLEKDERQTSKNEDEVKEWQKEYLEAQTDLIYSLKSIYEYAEKNNISKDTVRSFMEGKGLDLSLLNENANMLTSHYVPSSEHVYYLNPDGTVNTNYSGMGDYKGGMYSTPDVEFKNGVSVEAFDTGGEFIPYKDAEEAKNALKEMSETDFTKLLKQLELVEDKEEEIADNKLELNYNESAGTDTEFKKVVDEIDNLRGIKDKINNGKASYEDRRVLVDNYDALNDKVQETEDIMSITGEDIQDVIDDITDKVEKDLDKIIENAQKTMDEIDEIVNDGLDAIKKSNNDNAEEIGKAFEDSYSESYEKAIDALKKDGEEAELSFIDPTIVSGDIDLVIDKIEELGSAVSETEAIANMLEGAFAFANDGTTQEMLGLLSIAFDGLNESQWQLIAGKMAEDEVTLQQLATMAQEDEEVSKLFQEYGLLDGETGNLTITSQNLSSALPALIGNFNGLNASAQNAASSILSAAYSQGVMNNAINGSTAEQISSLSGKILATASARANGTKQEAVVRRSGIKNASNGKLGGSGSKGSGSKSSKNNYTSEDAAEDLKEILNDIEDYERDIEADLQDQTEELINHYNLEKNKLDTLKEELDYYDNIYDVTEKTTKWLETQMKILDEESKKVAEMQNSNEKIMAQREKIFKENSGYNVASWFDSEMNETLAYGDLLNSFEYRIEEVQKETAQKMRDVYNGVANSTDKDTIAKAKEKIKNIEDEGDLRVKELEKEKEKVENIYDSVEQLNDAWKDNRDAIRDALQELHDRVISVRDELVDDIMEQLERAVDKMNTSIEKDVTRLEQLKTIQESYNSILNDTIETQQSLDDELRANLDTYQYLDEEMRQLMFNEDDYKQLSGVLEGVQQDIADIWEDHYNQIQDLTEEEMYKAEYITNETERQLAAKEKEYALAKAELEVAKAQTQLDNVLNERNTRIFANGEWSWVANPDAVKSARQQLADAEREKTRIEREAEQQQLIDAMDKIIDSDNLQIDKNNDLLERIQEAIERETEEVKSIEQALTNAEGADLPALNTLLHGALGDDGGYMKELLGEINHSQKELAMALRGQTVNQAVNQLKSGKMSKGDFQSVIDKLGYSFNETTGMVTTQDGSFAAHYSGWTKKSNADTQLTTAPNGVQVTGTKAQSTQTNSSTTSIASAQAKASTNNLEQIAKEVWQGKWGNGQDRKNRLAAAGYDYAAVQALVNKGRNYFFDQGGVASGIGLLAKDTTLPERVLSPSQTRAFEGLMKNLTTNPVLNALSKVPMVSSKLGDMMGETNNNKVYNFSNFTVQADNIKEFINSIETIMPTKR